MKVANRLDKFPEYVFSLLGKKVKELEARTGKKVLDLSIGSPNFPTNKTYIAKLTEFYHDSKSSLYPGYGAIPELSIALQKWYKKRHNVLLQNNEILSLLGAKDAVSHLPTALLDEGDEILIPDPGYPAYVGTALMVGAVPIMYNLPESNNFKISISELEKKITKKTKCMWVNFPSNPTGQVATLDELKELVYFAKIHNIWILYDNAYSEIAFDNFTPPSILEVPKAIDIVVEINSFSKTFSFAGYRMGWAVGNKTIVNALQKVKSQIDSGLSLPLQKLGAYALTNPDKNWNNQMLAEYQKRRDILIQKVPKIGLIPNSPKGALYIWAKIPEKYKDSEQYCFELLEKKHIVVVPGTAFGNNGKRYVRISFCSDITHINNYL